MSEKIDKGQSGISSEKNSSFFRTHLQSYSQNVQQLDTYLRIRTSIEEAISGTESLLDVGNGGVFDYDTSLARKIVALDLFLEELPQDYTRPANATLKNGSALDIPEPSESFDAVLMVMLLHHLVGNTTRESVQNVRRALVEAYRVLRPGGKLVVIESCVSKSFFAFERLVFPLAAPLIHAAMQHPATLQYPASFLQNLITEETGQILEVTKIPLGRWVLQFGVKVPSVLSPVMPYRFIVHKRARTSVETLAERKAVT